MLVIALSIVALLSSQQGSTADARNVDDWTGVSQSLISLGQQLERNPPQPVDDLASLEFRPTEPLELRALCGAEADAVAASLVRRRCAKGSCASAPSDLAQIAYGAAAEVSGRLSAEGQSQVFLPRGSRLQDGPAGAEEALLYGAAADLWLRDWTDPLWPSAAGDETAFELQVMLMYAWCGLIGRNRAAALDWVETHGFPSDTDQLRRRLVPPMMYIIQHSPIDRAAVSRFREAAEATFLAGGLAPRTFSQILDIERTAFDGLQISGSFTSCENERAVFDPPLADSGVADRLRAAYGLPTRDQYLESASRRCTQ